jgi:hypothetical protein
MEHWRDTGWLFPRGLVTPKRRLSLNDAIPVRMSEMWIVPSIFRAFQR